MTDLAEFLEARLAEDEATAKIFNGVRWDVVRGVQNSDEWHLRENEDDRHRPFGVYITQRYYLDHIARHDPARVLREIEAKRAILAVHEHVAAVQQDDDQAHDFGCATCHRDNHCAETMGFGWCATVRHMAAAWSDHPDYQEAWRL